jgi:hypothetical protein
MPRRRDHRQNPGTWQARVAQAIETGLQDVNPPGAARGDGLEHPEPCGIVKRADHKGLGKTKEGMEIHDLTGCFVHM